MHPTSLQDTTAPEGVCFGCGSSNHHGLHIKSCLLYTSDAADE